MKIINYDILCTYCDFHALNWVCTYMQSCCRNDMFICYARTVIFQMWCSSHVL